MNNATQNLPTTCTDRDWCELRAGHGGEHEATADPAVTATGNRDDFFKVDGALQVPHVDVWLVEQRHSSNTIARQTVQLTVTRDEDHHATCYLTLPEAGLLRKHLHGLLQLVEEVAGR